MKPGVNLGFAAGGQPDELGDEPGADDGGLFAFDQGNWLLRKEGQEVFAEDPYALRAGIEASKRFPGKWRVSSELGYVYNDGFLFDSLNGSYYIWNASVSKTVFSGKGTLRLEASDIPGVQTNMTHRFSGMTIGATTWNGEQRYVILTFVYRFKSK